LRGALAQSSSLLREAVEVSSPTSDVGSRVRLTRLELNLHDRLLAGVHLVHSLGDHGIEGGVGSTCAKLVEPSHDDIRSRLQIGD
jgi:hypothetical protein